MIVTTKRGDHGQTSLYGATRVPKDHPLVELNGQLDELQVVIGLIKTKQQNRKLLAELGALQQFLYRLMAEVAGAKPLSSSDWNGILAALEENANIWLKRARINIKFVLPGRSEAEIACQKARVKTRAVERYAAKLSRKYPKLKRALPFLNRLSDYFFVLGESLVK